MNFESATLAKINDQEKREFGEFRSERRLSSKQEESLNSLLQFGIQNGNEMSILKPGLQLEGFIPETEAEELLQQFVASPMIKDTFDKDNSSRREWEKTYLFPQGGELLETYRQNKLSKARSMNVVSNFQLIYELEKDVTPEVAAQLSLLTEELEDLEKKEETGDPYDHFSLDEKVKFMDRYEQVALKILSLIAKNCHQQ